MSEAVLGASIRAFDEFSQQFQRLQRELRQTDREQRRTAQGTEQMNRSFSDFLQTIGGVGALYAFQQGLQAVIATGREFELSIRQAQAVTGDFTSVLRDFTMQADGGIHGPLQMAEAFYELGSAGLDANDTISSTPDILEFATAGLIDLEKSAYSVIATIQAFRMDWSQTGEVVDAFTESMNATTLAAQDFQWIMSSAGAVAKMAGQDFRQILAAGAAMKDAGVQAQDAGTSIKAALLQLINPTDEAKDILAELGVEIYNASGEMKQWHEIVGEFEEALVPYNQEAQNMILATVLGSDGIRAMATSLNMGSSELASYVDAMSSAEGATERMADLMADTLDGALKQTNANFERMKILIFEDLEPAMVALLGGLNNLIVGFNGLDETTRHMIEMLAGTAGLAVAITTAIRAVKTLTAAMRALGVSVRFAAGPIGVAIAVIGGLATALIAARGAAENARLEMEKQNQATVDLGSKYEDLTKKLSTLDEGTEEHKRTKKQLTQVMTELGEVYPGIIEQYNAEGEVIAINNGLLREKIRLSKQSLETTAFNNLESANQAYFDADKKLRELDERVEGLKSGEVDPERTSYQHHLSATYTRQKEIKDLANQRKQLQEERNKARAEVKKYSALTIGLRSDSSVDEETPVNAEEDGKPFTPPADRDEDKAKTPEQLAREQFEASRKFIEYRKALNQMALQEELAAWERVQARYKQGTDERMEADMEVYRVKQEIAQREKQLRDDAYNEAMDLMRHEVSMARMSTDERIRYLEKLRDAHEWSMRQMWDIEEELYRLRKQQLSGFLDELDSEYRDKLDSLDERTRESVQAIQDQIDALDEEGQESSREEDARQHNKRIQELQDKRRYHELRTGTEHQKAIADIEKQIAEEKRQFELQQQEWEREDQKDHLQEKLDQVREEGEQERDELKEHYDRAREIAENGIMDTIAALAATEPEWMDTGKQLVDALIKGMESGDFSEVNRMVDRVRDESDQRQDDPSPRGGGGDPPDDEKDPTALISSSQYKNINGAAAMWSRKLAGYLDEDISYDPNTGKVTIGGKKFAPIDNVDGKTYVKIRSVAEALGHDVEYDHDSKNIKIYHQGGPVGETGLAYLQQGEYVLPANLVDAIRMGAMPSSGSVTRGKGDTIIHINAPLLAPETMYLSDDMDISRVNSELKRGIMSLATAKGE